MRILVVGAGAIGGYFGGRLLEAGQDVTFLVRPGRRAALAASGLEIQSPNGDVTIAHPPLVLAENLDTTFDLILLSCKAYDLESAIQPLVPAVGAGTAILPLLNGMRHLEVLDRRFGAARVLGGLCVISSVLAPGGRIVHLNKLDRLVFGERDGAPSARVAAIAAAFAEARFESHPSGAILQEMWEKWVFIAACAGITCLMRASIGDIVAAEADGYGAALLEECAAISASQGYPPRAAAMEQSRTMLTAPGSELAASMLRDIERHARVEAEHMIGDLLRRGEKQALASPLLRLADAHLKAYEVRRERETRSGEIR